MKLDFVEICGFRGFRNKLRVEFAPGFTVINGRNGVGKSTVCDAIEFAITGEIDKYRVEKAAKEDLSDYLWWRGEGVAEAHYVTAGFVTDDHESFIITRTRESGANQSIKSLEEALCVPGAKPERALHQLCRTSIIRDEWIAALSLDLTETERFDLVRGALGAIDGPDYAGKAKDVVAAAEATRGISQREYEDTRVRLNQVIADLAEARDAVLKTGDVAAAFALLNAELGSTGETGDQITAARSLLARRRMRLEAVARAVEEAREIASMHAELEASSFQARKAEALQAVTSAQLTQRAAEAEATIANNLLATQERADAIAASLAALLEHGAHLGVNHGHCPLCDAERTPTEFAQGMERAKARLNELDSNIAETRRLAAEREQKLRATVSLLEEAQRQLSEIEASENAVSMRESRQIEAFDQHGIDHAFAQNPDALEQYMLAERSRLIDLERSILTLEASQAIGRVTELEVRVSTLRQELDAAAERLSKAQGAVTTAKSIDRAVRRASAEIIDERLALISPLLNELYQRLRPHADWRSIEYSVRGDIRRFLSLRVGDNLNPQFVFSSGQRRAAGLAFLLSVHLSRPWCRWRSLVLDDPVQHIDDYRALNLVEVLTALRASDRQIICAVEDQALADLLCRRLACTPDIPGRRYDLDLDEENSPSIARALEIPPMQSGVLSEAAGTNAAG